jgi:ketosteroid isomerase-like protein
MVKGDLNAMYELYADDYRSWSPGRGWMNKVDTLEFARFFRTLLVAWFTFEEPIVTVEGNRACTATASHAKLKNGNTYNNHYHFLQVIERGKILETREYNDSLHVSQVLAAELQEYRARRASSA